MNKNWYNIKAEASSKSADVYIFDEIGTDSLGDSLNDDSL